MLEVLWNTHTAASRRPCPSTRSKSCPSFPSNCAPSAAETRTKWVSKSALFFQIAFPSTIMRCYQTGVTLNLFLLLWRVQHQDGRAAVCHQPATHVPGLHNMTWTHYSRYSVQSVSKNKPLRNDWSLTVHCTCIHTESVASRLDEKTFLDICIPGKCIRSSCSSTSALDAQEPIPWPQQGFRSQAGFSLSSTALLRFSFITMNRCAKDMDPVCQWQPWHSNLERAEA